MTAIINGLQGEFGTLTNTGGTAQLGSIIGDVANSSLATRIAALQAYAAAMERCIEKGICVPTNPSVTLFTISGGPILVTEFVGLVSTQIGADATTCTIQNVVTAPAGTVALSTTVNIETDAVGTSYTFSAASPGVLTPTTAGALDQFPKNYWLCQPGTIKAAFSATTTGNIRWFMVYKPLSPLSAVA